MAAQVMEKKDGDLHPSAQETPSHEFSAHEFSEQEFSEQKSSEQKSSASYDAPVSDHSDDVTVLASAGFIETIEALWNNLQGAVQDQLQLAILETLRVGKGLVAIVIYTLVVALLTASAWLCAVAAVVLWLIHNGMNASVALLLAVMMNVLGVMVFVGAIARHGLALRFPATLNTLSTPFNATFSAGAKPTAGATPSATTQDQSERRP